MLSYILWNGSAEIFSWGQFSLRWNGLLLILAFLVCRQILIHFYKKEGLPLKDVDLLIGFLIIGIVIGGRLGQAIFFEKALWSRPLAIVFPFEFKPAFHFVGMRKFSSHGVVLGILAAVWLYGRRRKAGQQFLQVLDRISILAGLMAVALLVGSFLNSDIAGKPTGSPVGTVAIQPIVEGLKNLSCCVMRNPDGPNPLNQVNVKKDQGPQAGDDGHQPIVFYLFFKSGTTRQALEEFVIGDVKNYLYDMPQYTVELGTEPIHFTTFQEINEDFDVRIKTIAIARYPLQIFESISSLLIFIFLFLYWFKYKNNSPSGRIFGFFMILFWGLRFAYEFLADQQVEFVKGMGLNKGQVLCLPLLAIGIVVCVRSYRKAMPPAKLS